MFLAGCASYDLRVHVVYDICYAYSGYIHVNNGINRKASQR